MVIIDAHSHIGQDFLFGNSDLSEYVEMCKRNGITQGTLMPQPNACYVIKGKLVPCVKWFYEGQGKISYKTYDGINKNPYKYLNYYFYNECRKVKDIHIDFVPLIHPILDDEDYIPNSDYVLHNIFFQQKCSLKQPQSKRRFFCHQILQQAHQHPNRAAL